MTHSVKLNKNVEMSIWFDLKTDSWFFTDNSMSAVEREYVDVEEAKWWNLTRTSSKSWSDILGLNVYPVVDAFLISQPN